MRFGVVTAAVALAAVTGFSPALAADRSSPFSLGAHLGTLGYGVEAEYVVNPYLSARVEGDFFNYTHGLDTRDINYAGRIDYTTVGLFADFHPFKNEFFLSGGLYEGERKLSVSGTPAGNRVINGITYIPAQIGQVTGVVKMPRTTPFVGIGWDGAQRRTKGVHFKFIAGAAFGKPTVDLVATGPAFNTANVQSYVADQKAQAQAKVNNIQVYPVVDLGLGYSF